MYAHILLPTDGSELSKMAIREGVDLARVNPERACPYAHAHARAREKSLKNFRWRRGPGTEIAASDYGLPIAGSVQSTTPAPSVTKKCAIAATAHRLGSNGRYPDPGTHIDIIRTGVPRQNLAGDAPQRHLSFSRSAACTRGT